ncbi:hypothetical protein KIPB_002020 [Kipferlia bialata]|uniref:Methyltransferase-like protein 5 n=1 Tax=Kipferlia bialata TaxID=797122 RepID=A0A9K3CRH5_9EUKA|nr:hypothetical protein KIPB_002020 [Kipferlia bialata]|eukprot:g2020.t1
MKLWEIEEVLRQGVPSWSEPDVELEQYATPPDIASRIAFVAENTYGDITNKAVADLGCGPGMLSAAVSVFSPAALVSLDISEDSLDAYTRTREALELTSTLVHCDVAKHCPLRGNSVDTVVMNPPFGTRLAGVDVAFLAQGCLAATTSVYSLHKSSTVDHLVDKAAKTWSVIVSPVFRYKFPLPATYDFHKANTKDIEVTLIRCDLKHKDQAALEMSLAQLVSRLGKGKKDKKDKRGKGKGRGKGRGGYQRR